MELLPKDTERRKVGQGDRKDKVRENSGIQKKNIGYVKYFLESVKNQLSNQKLVSFLCYYHFISVRALFTLEKFIVLMQPKS